MNPPSRMQAVATPDRHPDFLCCFMGSGRKLLLVPGPETVCTWPAVAVGSVVRVQVAAP